MQKSCEGPSRKKHPEAVSMRIEWAYTSNELRDLGCNFLFVDESGFDVSLSRGRGMQEWVSHQVS